eukprot:Hpha_TRINITY_DN36604_c0_g1::TRINITY_DN36604_c0_g1_i1::g.18739::m.18739
MPVVRLDGGGLPAAERAVGRPGRGRWKASLALTSCVLTATVVSLLPLREGTPLVGATGHGGTPLVPPRDPRGESEGVAERAVALFPTWGDFGEEGLAAALVADVSSNRSVRLVMLPYPPSHRDGRTDPGCLADASSCSSGALAAAVLRRFCARQGCQ